MREKKPTSEEYIVSMWRERFTAAEGNQQQLFHAMQRWYDDFYAVFRANVAPWRSKVIDPKVASKALSIIAKLSLADPQPKVTPNDVHDYIKAQNNEQFLEYQMNNPCFDQPMFFKKYSVLSDAVVTGTGLALLPWSVKKRTYMQRILDENGKVSLDKERKVEQFMGYNDFIPWSIFRVFIEPGASSLHSARWVILQDWKTKSEIEAMSNSYEIYKNLDKLNKMNEGSDSANTNVYEEARNRFLNQHGELANDSTLNKIELWHCYDRLENKFYTLANGKVVIREQDSPYWHGQFPGVAFYVRPRAHSFWGDGLFERTERLAAANNSIINHFLDQLDLSLNGMVMHREDVIVDMDVSPGGAVVWQGTEAPVPWEIPQPDSGGLAVARKVLTEAIEENTLSNYEMGVPRSNTDQTQGTKGGIQAIQEAAGDMVRFFTKSFATSCTQWFQMWLSNNQEFLDHDVAIRILGPNGYVPKTIRPEDIVTQGALDVTVDAEELRVRGKQDDRAMKLAWVDRQLALYQVSAQSQNPININFYEMSRVVAEAMEVKDFDRMIEPMPMANDSPTTENQLLLQGKTLQAHPEEDHETHLYLHAQLMADPGVDLELKEEVIEPHMQMHEMFFEQMKMMQEQQEVASLGQMVEQTAQLADVPALGAQPMMPPGGENVPIQINSASQPSVPPRI